MASPSHFILLLPLLFLSAALLLPSVSCSDGDDFVISYCEKVVRENQPNPTFADKMLSELVQWAPEHGFMYSNQLSAGLYGLAWCRGDFSPDRCSACLANATGKLVGVCSHEAVAARLVYGDFCYLRIDVEDFIKKIDTYFGRILLDNSTDQQIAEANRGAYWDSVGALLGGLKKAIPRGEKRFAKMKVIFDSENLKIYAMGQCLQGSGEETCKACLDHTMEYLMGHCNYGRHCEIFYGSCFLKYYTRKL